MRLHFSLASVLTVVALVAVACTGGGGASPTAPGPGQTDGGGDGDGDGDAGGYPERDITFVVPFSAGGPTDTVTRLIEPPMEEVLGADIVVENREGAGGTVAAQFVADAEPDGYTVLMHHIGMSTAPALYAELGYAPLEDFQTVGLVTEVPMTIVGRADLEPETLEELVAYVEENGDAVRYAHAGTGAASQLCGLLFQDAIGVQMTEVPYEGTAEALAAVRGGQDADLVCDQTTNTTEPIEAGEVKPYAVTTPERVETLPDIPTTEEAGLPEVQVGVWHGLYVPAGTPDEAVQALTDALQQALTDETVIERLATLGAAPYPEDQATPEAHTELLQSQLELWAQVIADAGVEPQ